MNYIGNSPYSLQCVRDANVQNEFPYWSTKARCVPKQICRVHQVNQPVLMPNGNFISLSVIHSFYEHFNDYYLPQGYVLSGRFHMVVCAERTEALQVLGTSDRAASAVYTCSPNADPTAPFGTWVVDTNLQCTPGLVCKPSNTPGLNSNNGWIDVNRSMLFNVLVGGVGIMYPDASTVICQEPELSIIPYGIGVRVRQTSGLFCLGPQAGDSNSNDWMIHPHANLNCLPYQCSSIVTGQTVRRELPAATLVGHPDVTKKVWLQSVYILEKVHENQKGLVRITCSDNAGSMSNFRLEHADNPFYEAGETQFRLPCTLRGYDLDIADFSKLVCRFASCPLNPDGSNRVIPWSLNPNMYVEQNIPFTALRQERFEVKCSQGRLMNIDTREISDLLSFSVSFACSGFKEGVPHSSVTTTSTFAYSCITSCAPVSTVTLPSGDLTRVSIPADEYDLFRTGE